MKSLWKKGSAWIKSPRGKIPGKQKSSEKKSREKRSPRIKGPRKKGPRTRFSQLSLVYVRSWGERWSSFGVYGIVMGSMDKNKKIQLPSVAFPCIPLKENTFLETFMTGTFFSRTYIRITHIYFVYYTYFVLCTCASILHDDLRY